MKTIEEKLHNQEFFHTFTREEIHKIHYLLEFNSGFDRDFVMRILNKLTKNQLQKTNIENLLMATLLLPEKENEKLRLSVDERTEFVNGFIEQDPPLWFKSEYYEDGSLQNRIVTTEDKSNKEGWSIYHPGIGSEGLPKQSEK